jgi:hypothetical protein
VLDRPIVGQGLSGSTLGEELRGEAALIVFLRHFG